jgi:hypothetical protein
VQINRVDIDPDTSGRDDYDLSCRLHQHKTGGFMAYQMIGSWQPYTADTTV